MAESILITGGAGAIGSCLANTLSADRNRKITILDNLSSGHLQNVEMRPNVRFIQGSVESDEDLDRVFSQPVDMIYHLAANFANQNSVDFPQRDLQVNGMGTLKLLLRAAHIKVKKFLYTSSSCVYGNRNEPLDEKLQEFSLDTPYAITKLLGERYVRFFNHHHQLPVVTLRYFNVYGPNEYPGRYRNVIANFFHLAMQGKDLTVTGSGEETRDFNYVDDSVRATILAAQKDSAVGKVLNIASGTETNIDTIVKHIMELTGSKSRVLYRARRNWDTVTRRVAATEQARQVLGYQPEISIKEGLRRYYEWLKKQDLSKCEC